MQFNIFISAIIFKINWHIIRLFSEMYLVACVKLM